jgi:hypothetical protein
MVVNPDVESHRAHLHAVHQGLQEFGLLLNVKKCQLGHQPVDIFSHRISALLKHMAAVQECPLLQAVHPKGY